MFLVCIDFLFQHFPSLSDHLSIYYHHSFIHRRAVALTAQDFCSSTKQITAVAHAVHTVKLFPLL